MTEYSVGIPPWERVSSFYYPLFPQGKLKDKSFAANRILPFSFVRPHVMVTCHGALSHVLEETNAI
jgi:hypothetical protein